MRLASAKFGTGTFYPFMASGLFTDCKMMDSASELTKDDTLVVWGGADISPSLYNRAVGSRTNAREKLSDRDAYEWALMQRAKELGIPILGICRGAQMLCALAGGFLIQDVTNHGGDHKIATHDGKVLNVNSIHHQMMNPFAVAHKMLAWTQTPRSRHYLDVDDPIEMEVEPEYVYFPQVKGHAVQWHPEFMDDETAATEYIFKHMKELTHG